MTDRKEIALITGATSGIGEAYCRALVGKVQKMILVGRREERLQQICGELKQQGVEASYVVADLQEPLGVTRVVEAVRQRGPITLLINNAGFGTLGPFVEQTIESQHAMIALHAGATISLCRAVIPYMKEASGGAIINVSSMASFFPMKDVAVYCGSKAFLNSFSEALQQEVADDGIRVQCLCPGYTRTEFHSRDSFAGFDPAEVPESMWMDSEQVVEESLAALAADDSSVVFVAGEGNRKMVAAVR